MGANYSAIGHKMFFINFKSTHPLFYYRIGLASVLAVCFLFVTFESVWIQDMLDYQDDVANRTNHKKEELILDILTIKSDSIFFVESTGRNEFRGRHLCSFESAAKHNPKTPIYIVMTVDTVPQDAGVNTLRQTYHNIHLRKLNVERFLRGKSPNCNLRGKN